MFKGLRNYIEPDRNIRICETVVLILLLLISGSSYIYGFNRLNKIPGALKLFENIKMIRDESLEDYDDDSTVCDVVYVNGDNQIIKRYSYEEYENLDIDEIDGYVYIADDGMRLCFDHIDPSDKEIADTYRQIRSAQLMPVFNLANALIILFISLLIVMLYSKFFTTYEKIWFLSIMVLATIVAVLFPEESANGVSGIVIMLLYLMDTFLNILCELLISKQSRYNFLVSVLVEITEIVICLVLMYRFATMAVTLFFWLPIDILSFINWSRHKDKEEDELTVVRRLKGYQEVLVILVIIIWTVVVGYFISGLDIKTVFIQSRSLQSAIAYIDACASAVGIANGLFIFFRLSEQWIAWYICAILESIINILSGQYVLLVLKLGYFTNTTYGFIKWNRYIRTHKTDSNSLF